MSSTQPEESDCVVTSTTSPAFSDFLQLGEMDRRTYGMPSSASGEQTTDASRSTQEFPFAALAANQRRSPSSSSAAATSGADNIFLHMNFTDSAATLSPWLAALPAAAELAVAGAAAASATTLAEASSKTPGNGDATRNSSSSDGEDSDDSEMCGEDATEAKQDSDDTKPSSTVNDCVICGPGEKATGSHFGAMTCEACKAFFRRTVRRSRNYSCKMDRLCEIDRETRNHCQYCRLQKCLRMGMKKESVQYGRGPIKNPVEQRSKALDDLLQRCPSANAAVPMPAVSDLYVMDFFHQLPEEDGTVTLKHMIEAEQRTRERVKLPDFAPSAARSLNEVVQAFRALFLDVINWAKLLPEFDDLGSPKNQADALRVSWMDLATFSLATQAQPGDRSDAIFLNAQHVISRSDDCFDRELAQLIGRLIDELIIPFQTLNITEMEKACIRGLLFFSPEKHRSEMELANRMNFYQEALMEKLMDDCTISLHFRKSNRYGKLLLRISAMQAISAELFRYFMLKDTTFFNARGSGGTGSYGVNTVLNTMLLLPMNE